MEENLIVTEKELNSFLNNLELKFIAQKLKIENVDKSIITLLKIVKNLQQENKQLNNILTELEKWLKEEMNKLNESKLETLEELHRVVRLKTFKDIQNKITELKEKHK